VVRPLLLRHCSKRKRALPSSHPDHLDSEAQVAARHPATSASSRHLLHARPQEPTDDDDRGTVRPAQRQAARRYGLGRYRRARRLDIPAYLTLRRAAPTGSALVMSRTAGGTVRARTNGARPVGRNSRQPRVCRAAAQFPRSTGYGRHMRATHWASTTSRGVHMLTRVDCVLIPRRVCHHWAA